MTQDLIYAQVSAWPWRIQPMTANDEPASPDRAERFEITSFDNFTVAVTDNLGDARLIAAAPGLAGAAKRCLTIWRALYEDACDSEGDADEMAAFRALDDAIADIDHQLLQDRSPEQVLEAAMCIWEHIDQVSRQGDGVRSPLGQLRADIGSPSMRYYAGQIAAQGSEAYAIAEQAAGGFYDEPFDWHFVPSFLDRAVLVGVGRFTLRDDWRCIARDLGRALLSTPIPAADGSMDAERGLSAAFRSFRSRFHKAAGALWRHLKLVNR